MTDKTALRQLIEAVEAGNDDGLIRKVDLLHALINGHAVECALDAYHGSLDAAKSLHEALLPGWVPKVYSSLEDDKSTFFQVVLFKGGRNSEGEGKNFARAWLISILKAYEAQQ